MAASESTVRARRKVIGGTRRVAPASLDGAEIIGETDTVGARGATADGLLVEVKAAEEGLAVLVVEVVEYVCGWGVHRPYCMVRKV